MIKSVVQQPPSLEDIFEGAPDDEYTHRDLHEVFSEQVRRSTVSIEDALYLVGQDMKSYAKTGDLWYLVKAKALVDGLLEREKTRRLQVDKP